jgi:uncharacterized membrane protein YgaE (UPF0421/DUF939 family)
MTHFWMGKRILKTGLAVFITAQICDWLGWPSIFAIIAAIVTIEPSIDMSIKKGMYRLPSAAIGAMFAMLFDSMLGQQPITYMLSAVATIYLIQLLKWNDSLVIATLTSVNMITMTEANFGENFFVRLGTTAIGIIVSALINYLVSPPKYMKSIHKNTPQLVKQTVALADRIVGYSLHRNPGRSAAALTIQLKELNQSLTMTLQNISWQLADYRYKKPDKAELRQILVYKRTLGKLQSISTYLDIIIHSPPVPQTVRSEIPLQLWEQWRRFEKIDQPIQFPSTAEALDDEEAQLVIESLFCHIEFIHILLRELPPAVLNAEVLNSLEE